MVVLSDMVLWARLSHQYSAYSVESCIDKRAHFQRVLEKMAVNLNVKSVYLSLNCAVIFSAYKVAAELTIVFMELNARKLKMRKVFAVI